MLIAGNRELVTQSAQKRPPIRVGVICPCPPPHGGVTRMVQSYISHWDPDEVEVHFLPIFPTDDAEPFIGAEFHRLASDGPRSWRGLSTWAKVARHLPLTRPHIYPLFARYNASLSALIESEGINVIYAHGVWPAGVAAVLQSRLHGVASVVTTYGEITKATPAYRRLQRTGKFVSGNADFIASCSKYCLDLALNLGADPTRSQSIPVGVDVERFRPGMDGNQWRIDNGIPTDAIVVSVLGHVIHRKLDTFFDALPHVTASGDIRYLVGGNGHDFDHFSGKAAELSKSSNVSVKMLGFVSEENLLGFYAATDIFVASPSTEIECLGLTLLEAMACGIPVAAANIGGVPEFVRNGENGATFIADDPPDFARVLTELIEEPELRARLAKAGNVTALEKFDVRGMADTILDIFRNQVAEKQNR